MFEKRSRGDTTDVPTHVLPDVLSFVVLPMLDSATILKFRAVSQATQGAADRGLLTAAALKTFVAPKPEGKAPKIKQPRYAGPMQPYSPFTGQAIGELANPHHFSGPPGTGGDDSDQSMSDMWSSYQPRQCCRAIE